MRYLGVGVLNNQINISFSYMDNQGSVDLYFNINLQKFSIILEIRVKMNGSEMPVGALAAEAGEKIHDAVRVPFRDSNRIPTVLLPPAPGAAYSPSVSF